MDSMSIFYTMFLYGARYLLYRSSAWECVPGLLIVARFISPHIRLLGEVWRFRLELGVRRALLYGYRRNLIFPSLRIHLRLRHHALPKNWLEKKILSIP